MRIPVWQVMYRHSDRERVFETCASVFHAMDVAHMLLGLRIAQHVVIMKI